MIVRIRVSVLCSILCRLRTNLYLFVVSVNDVAGKCTTVKAKR